MQFVLVIITFALAVGYLVRKFIWLPITETHRKPVATMDGGRIKCGKDNCACH